MHTIEKIRLSVDSCEKRKLEIVDGAMRLYNNSKFFGNKDLYQLTDVGVDLSKDFLDTAIPYAIECIRKKETHEFLIPNSFIDDGMFVTEFGSFLLEKNTTKAIEDCLFYLQREVMKGHKTTFNLLVKN